jgi:hypothetical protein
LEELLNSLALRQNRIGQANTAMVTFPYWDFARGQGIGILALQNATASLIGSPANWTGRTPPGWVSFVEDWPALRLQTSHC